MIRDDSPTARALLSLELLQASPGITAERLGNRLGVSERAARRYVGMLREAGVPVESTRGPGGGFRLGRGLRIPPLMLTAAEALGLVMTVQDGYPSPTIADPVDTALGKIIRVLPTSIATPAEAIRRSGSRAAGPGAVAVDPQVIAELVRASTDRRRLRLGYAIRPSVERVMEVDPWAVVVRHRRWYLLCWSHTRSARRVLRTDRITTVDVLADGFEPPAGLDPSADLEEHLSQGWKYAVEVVIEASAASAAAWIPRGLGRLEPIDADTTRLLATTDEPDWYARQLTAIDAPFRVVGSAELCEAVAELSERLRRAAS